MPRSTSRPTSASSTKKTRRASKPAAKRSRTARAKGSSSTLTLIDKALNVAADQDALDPNDEFAFAWGWVVGYNTAKREQ